MKILVTGAAGFIGSNFVRMIAKGDLQGISSVTVLDKLTYAGVIGNLDSVAILSCYEFKQGDICDPLVVTDLLKEVDAVINFAAESHVDRSIADPDAFIETNILGTYQLLKAARKIWAKDPQNHVRHSIYISGCKSPADYTCWAASYFLSRLPPA